MSISHQFCIHIDRKMHLHFILDFTLDFTLQNRKAATARVYAVIREIIEKKS